MYFVMFLSAQELVWPVSDLLGIPETLIFTRNDPVQGQLKFHKEQDRQISWHRFQKMKNIFTSLKQFRE